MSVFTKVFDALGGSLVKSVGDIIDNVHTSGDEKRAAEIAKAQLQLEAKKAVDKARQDAEELYVRDLESHRKMVTVEVQSEDAYVRRSRPTGNYIFYLVIIFNFVLPAILASVGLGEPAQIELPNEFWYAFGVNFVGYAYFRSKDKE